MDIIDRPYGTTDSRLRDPEQGQQQVGERSSRFFRLLAALGLLGGSLSAVLGFLNNDALALAVSAGLLGCGFLAMDAANVRRGGLSPMTLYTLTWTLASFANATAVANQDTAKRAQYFLYAVDEHLLLATIIAWFGLVMPVLGFRWFIRSPSWRYIGALMPAIRGSIPDNQLVRLAIFASVLGIAANITGWLPSLGTLTAIVFFFPHLAAFTLARRGMMRKWPKAVWIGLAIAGAEGLRALVNEYLRSNIVSPIFAYAAGILMGARSMRALRSVFMLPVYAVAVPFIVYFGAFGEVRGTASGLARIAVVHEFQEAQVAAGESSPTTLVTRFSNINQLTQVGRIVKEDGFRNGETLEYLAFAWIPRFLWPEKPAIAKGAWFAYRIGQARIFQGRITNSVNMTIPGEFYLNFGLLGVLIGPFLFGGVLALFWQTTSFWQRPQDALGSAFGFYLIWVGVVGGADLQIVVTLVAVYLLFAAGSLLLQGSQGHPRTLVQARKPLPTASGDAA